MSTSNNEESNFSAAQNSGVPQLSFLYEDDAIFAVEKPPGIHSVMLRESKGMSVAKLLLARNPALSAAAQKTEDAGLINRLDQETSGILLGAKSRAAWDKFSQLLKTGKIKKTYLVLVEGEIAGEESVRGWIGSPNRHAKKMRVYTSKPSPRDRALPARSTITPLHYDSKLNVTVARVRCDSAKRHQVRAHCSFIGHPLAGDGLYGSKQELKKLFAESMRSFFLHAATADFLHPETKLSVSISAPPDEFFLRHYGNLKNI